MSDRELTEAVYFNQQNRIADLTVERDQLRRQRDDLLEACKKVKARYDKIGLDRLNDEGLAEYSMLRGAIASVEGWK